MKKLILLVCFSLIGFFYGCNSDNNSESNERKEMKESFKAKADCPEGMVWVVTEEILTHRLHRASKGCTSGFSICRVYQFWGRCEEEGAYSNVGLNPSYNSVTGMTTFVGQKIKGADKLLLRFPKELLTDPSFVPSDFQTFIFEENYRFDIYTAKAGKYIPEITNSEIQVTVDLL